MNSFNHYLLVPTRITLLAHLDSISPSMKEWWSSFPILLRFIMQFRNSIHMHVNFTTFKRSAYTFHQYPQEKIKRYLFNWVSRLTVLLISICKPKFVVQLYTINFLPKSGRLKTIPPKHLSNLIVFFL